MTSLAPALPRTWPRAAGLVLAAGVAGAAAFTLDWRLLVPIGLGLPLAAVVVLDDLATVPAGGGGSPGAPAGPWTPRASRAREWTGLHGHRSLAVVWALLFFGSEFKFLAGNRPAHLAASGNLSGDNIVELLTYVPAALVVGSALRHGWPGRVPRIALAYGLYAILALLSVSWSEIPLLSAGMALQFCTLAALVAYCASRAAGEPDFAERLLLPLLRYIVFGVALMAVYGILDGLLAAPRFTWRGQHPNGAAALMLVPCLALLFHPRRSFITRPLPWWVIPLGLVPLIHATGSRANVAGAIVAVFVGWAIMATRNSRIGAFGTGVGLLVVGSALGYASEEFTRWFYRGQSTAEVTGLNGRIELWTYALENPLGSQVWGVGVGAARSDWPFSWNPQHVHSAWIDSLLTLGVIGAALLGAVVVSLLVLVVVRRPVQAAWMAALVTVASINSVTISQTGYSLVILCLALVVISAARPPGEPRPERTAPPPRPPAADR